MGERQEANKLDARLATLGKMLRPDMEPFNQITPLDGEHCFWGPAWGIYYKSHGKSGIKPTADALRLQELVDKLNRGPDFEEIKVIMAEIAEIHKNNLFAIGAVGERPSPYVAANYIKNMPTDILATGLYRDIARICPQQIYIEK